MGKGHTETQNRPNHSKKSKNQVSMYRFYVRNRTGPFTYELVTLIHCIGVIKKGLLSLGTFVGNAVTTLP
jgi:hypothetical protein